MLRTHTRSCYSFAYFSFLPSYTSRQPSVIDSFVILSRIGQPFSWYNESYLITRLPFLLVYLPSGQLHRLYLLDGRSLFMSYSSERSFDLEIYAVV
jgi:hypothetical protein